MAISTELNALHPKIRPQELPWAFSQTFNQQSHSQQAFIQSACLCWGPRRALGSVFGCAIAFLRPALAVAFDVMQMRNAVTLPSTAWLSWLAAAQPFP